MVGENEKTCPSCGAPHKEGASFCTNCGASLPAPEAAAAGVYPPAAGPPGTESPPPGPPPPAPPAAEGAPETPMPGMVPAPPVKRGKAPLLLGLIGGILVVAGIVVLVLWLTVWSGGEAGSGDPISLAEKYISAMEEGDVDAYFECFTEDFFSMEEFDFMEEMGMDVKGMIEMAFDFSEFRFDGYGLELVSESGDKAKVVTTEGTLFISSMGFEEEYDLADEPMVFDMVKVDGKWYLTDDPMPGSMGGDVDLDDFDFEDMDLEDMDFEEMLPDDLNLEDLEDLDADQLLEDLDKLLEDMPAE